VKLFRHSFIMAKIYRVIDPHLYDELMSIYQERIMRQYMDPGVKKEDPPTVVEVSVIPSSPVITNTPLDEPTVAVEPEPELQVDNIPSEEKTGELQPEQGQSFENQANASPKLEGWQSLNTTVETQRPLKQSRSARIERRTKVTKVICKYIPSHHI